MISRKEGGVPFTSSDLRMIADSMDKILQDIGTPDGALDDNDGGVNGEWRYGISVSILDDMDWLVGKLAPYEDWIGFYPEGWE